MCDCCSLFFIYTAVRLELAVACIAVLEETSMEHRSYVSGSNEDELLPPNLVWRFALAVEHEKVRISRTQGTGQSAIAVYCPEKECSYVHAMPYIDFQRVLYLQLSNLPNDYIDHLGTFLVRKNKLLIEVHFTSSDQIKRCIDGLDTLTLSKALTGTFCSFVKSFERVELDVALVIQSNIESRLRLVTRENAAHAFSIVYTNRPALTLFHIQNPEIYGPIKQAYSQLLAAFPDFLGEVGSIDLCAEQSSQVLPEVAVVDSSSGELRSMPVLEALRQLSKEEYQKQLHENLSNSLHTDPMPMKKGQCSESESATLLPTALTQSPIPTFEITDENAACNHSSETLSEKSISKGTFLTQRDQPLTNSQSKSEESMSSGRDEQHTHDAAEKSIVTDTEGKKDTTNVSQEGVRSPSASDLTAENNETYVDEAISNEEICNLATQIPTDQYKLLGIYLGLEENTIERIKYDSQGKSLDYILGILFQANKQLKASRQTFATALLHCGLLQQAKMIDPSLDFSALGSKPLPPLSVTPMEHLCLVDGQLHFYDKDLAREHLGKQQSVVFWKKLHKELSSTVSEALRCYGVYIHSTTEGSLIVHIKLSSYNQAKILSIDIASGKLINQVEAKMKAVGFTGRLAIDFDINQVRITPLHCYEVYVKALLSIHSQRAKGLHHKITAKKMILKQPKPSNTAQPVQALNQAQPDLNEKPTSTKSSWNPGINVSLSDVIVHGTLKQLQDALNGGADLTVYQNGFLPIHIAAHYGKSEMIEMLVMHRAAIHAKTKTKEEVAALHLAAYSGHLESVKVLINLGANIEAPSVNGSTPLRLAAGRGNILVTKFLLEKGADPNTKCKEAKTPLYDAITREHLGIAELLLHHGANVTLPSVDGETPIHHAIIVGNVKMLELLVSADPEALSHTNVVATEPPLITACKLQKAVLVKVLLNMKADPNVCNKDSMTPLAVASCLENLEIMELLIKHSANMILSFPPHGTPLHIVAAEGKVNATRKLLNMGINPNVVDSEGTTPLRRAVENQRTEVASLLLKHGADINVECPGDELPLLHKAAKRNNIKMLKLLIENGADPYETGIKGGTALFTAAANNSVDAIDHLCTYPGLIDIPNKSKITPLMAAIFQRKYDCALQLLKHKPNVSICNLDGMTALYICVDFRAPADVVRAILNCNPTIDSPGPEGISPIKLACHRGFAELVKEMLDVNRDFFKINPKSSYDFIFTAIDSGSRGTLEALLQHGANPDCIHPQMPMTPLHYLCRQHNTADRLLQVVLSHNPNVNIVTEMGAPLHVAVVTKKNTYVSMLLNRNANPNVVSGPEMATPLVIAAETNNLEAACLLLDHGAEINHALATNGFTSLHKAATSNFTEMAQLLIDRGAKVDQQSKLGYTPLHVAVSVGSQEVFAVLIENNSNINAQDHTGGTPLIHAIHKGENEVALTLIELGADVHQCNADGLHPLHICARIGSVNIVTRLLDLGADPNTQESNGATPLLLSVVGRQQGVAKVLLEKGASVDLADVQKNTPLHGAAEENDLEAVRLLLEHGADPTLCNLKGKTPADITDSRNVETIIVKATWKKVQKQLESLKIEEVAHHLAGTGRAAVIAADFGCTKNQWENISHSHKDDTQRMVTVLKQWKQNMTQTSDEKTLKKLLKILNDNPLFTA